MSSIKTINPATGEVLKEYPEMTSGEVSEIIAQADATFKECIGGKTKCLKRIVNKKARKSL